MRNVLVSFITLLGLMVWSSLGRAQTELPDWVFRVPRDTESERFYIGSSENAASHAEAIEAASKSAMDRAIRENFGIEAQISSQTYETNASVSLTSAISERSRKVRLQGFETRDSVVRNTAKGWSAWIMFAYKRSEIQAEKHRLENLAESPSATRFAEMGTASSLANGTLEIVTDPEGATVTVDGRDLLAKTPIRLSGVLEIGKHSVVIDDPNYKAIAREIVITPGSTTRLNEILLPAKGWLSITTEPAGASILVDGRVVGASPINGIEVLTNRKIKIDFVHPDSFASSVEVSVAREERRTVVHRLSLKPGQLQVTVLPTDAQVRIDGQLTRPGWQSIQPGIHVISAIAPGYQNMQRTIELRGGEKKIEQLTLTSLSEVEKQEISNRERLEKSPYIFGIALSVHDATHQTYGDLSTVGIDLNVEKKFFNIFGLRAQASLLNAEETNTTGDKSPRNVDGTQYSVALPVYLTSSIYIGPIRSMTKQTVSCKSTFGNCQDYKLSQTSSGWIVGYQGSWKDDYGIDVNYNNQKYSDDKGFSGLSSSTWTLSFCYRF